MGMEEVRGGLWRCARGDGWEAIDVRRFLLLRVCVTLIIIGPGVHVCVCACV